MKSILLKKLIVKMAIVVSILFGSFATTMPKANAYAIVSTILFDPSVPNMGSDTRAICAFFFFVCVPFIILGEEGQADLNLGLDKAWLEESYGEADVQLIQKDLSDLQLALDKTQADLKPEDKKTIVITADDNKESLNELFTKFGIAPRNLTIEALIDNFSLSVE